MRQQEQLLEAAAHKCRSLMSEIADTIIEIETQRAKAGVTMADMRRPMHDRSEALLEFSECEEAIAMLQRFHSESVVASEVLFRGSAVAFVTFIEDFEEAIQERQERYLRLGFRSTDRFNRFLSLLRSASVIADPKERN